MHIWTHEHTLRTLQDTSNQLETSTRVAKGLESQLACAVFERDVLERTLQVVGSDTVFTDLTP